MVKIYHASLLVAYGDSYKINEKVSDNFGVEFVDCAQDWIIKQFCQ